VYKYDNLDSRLVFVEDADLVFNMLDNFVSMPILEQERVLLLHKKYTMPYFPDKYRYIIEIPLDGESTRRICLWGNHVTYNHIPNENLFSLDNDGHTMVLLDNKLTH
jgi:hypothetical protein